MTSLSKWISHHMSVIFFTAILTGITLFIALQNHIPGTWLSGWDTLHPEFNFDINFERLIQGVWRYDQGLGSVAGHSHMADLPRVVILWLFHFLMPLNFLRYAYIFLMLIIGPIGMFFLLREVFKHEQEKLSHIDLIAFLGSCIYLLNFGTVQQFFVPFEMFPTQWAYLPWIILITIKLLRKFSPRNIFLFICLNLLATPQAYAAQLWYAFFGTYLAFLTLYTLNQTHRRLFIKKSIFIVLLCIGVNLFWLLPNLYYITHEGNTPSYSKQNRLSSEEYQLRNRQFGHIDDVALIKGFYYDWSIYDFNTNTFGPLMPEWQSHLSRSHIKLIGFSLFGSVLLGILIAYRKKNRLFVSFIPYFLIPLVLLANRVPPFNLLFDVLLKLPLAQEGLRFVFTKFSTLLIFSYALYTTYLLFWISTKVSKLKQITLFAFIFCSLIIFVFPIFSQGLISSKMAINFPRSYFEFWSYMNKQRDGRIITLPLNEYSGWQYNNWGYQGSGFLWFGLKQQLLDRDSDRWNLDNEEAYRESKYALYSKNSDLFYSVLHKYNVQYIVRDKSVITSDQKNREQVLFTRETDAILQELVKNQKLHYLRSFSYIDVYKTNYEAEYGTVVQGSIPNIEPPYVWNSEDVAYTKFGLYQTNISEPEDIYFPFRSFLNIKDRVNLGLVTIDTTHKTYSINMSSVDVQDKFITLPNLGNTEKTVDTEVYFRNDGKTKNLILHPKLLNDLAITGVVDISHLKQNLNKITFNGAVLNIDFNRISSQPQFVGQATINLDSGNYIEGQLVSIDLQYPTQGNITKAETQIPSSYIVLDGKTIFNNTTQGGEFFLIDDNNMLLTRFSTTIPSNGAFIPFPDLTHAKGYIIQLTSRNIKGIPLRICLFNDYTKTCNLTGELTKYKDFGSDTFIVPPTDDAIGYSLRIDNASFGGESSINDIKEIIIIPVSYNFLAQIYFQKNNLEAGFSHLSTAQRVNNYTFSAFTGNSVDKLRRYAILYQSNKVGWHAYQISDNNFTHLYFPFLFGREIKEKVSINNWAQAWVIPPSSNNDSKIIMIFTPQILEYAGFTILAWLFITSIIYCLIRRKSYN